MSRARLSVRSWCRCPSSRIHIDTHFRDPSPNRVREASSTVRDLDGRGFGRAADRYNGSSFARPEGTVLSEPRAKQGAALLLPWVSRSPQSESRRDDTNGADSVAPLGPPLCGYPNTMQYLGLRQRSLGWRCLAPRLCYSRPFGTPASPTRGCRHRTLRSSIVISFRVGFETNLGQSN